MSSPAVKARDKFRTLVRNVPAGVSVLTGWGEDSKPLGVVVSSFVPLSLDPRMCAFSIKRGAWTFAQIRQTGLLGVSVLASDQHEACQRFAAAGVERFETVPWHTGAQGLPFLDGVVAELVCRIYAVHDGGDHDLFVVRVEDLQTCRDTDHLVLVDGRFGRADMFE